MTATTPVRCEGVLADRVGAEPDRAQPNRGTVEGPTSLVRMGRTTGVGLRGIDGFLVEVEAQIAPGLPAFTVSGMGDSAVAQAPDRIRAACAALGLPVHQRKVVVNLSPAAQRKSGSGFDVAIAVAVLQAAGIVTGDVRPVVHLGELGLAGQVRPVAGVLPAVLAARQAGIREVVVPRDNAAEALLAGDLTVYAVGALRDVLALHAARDRGGSLEGFLARPGERPAGGAAEDLPDLADLVGQEAGRQAVEVAAAGGHHLFLVGPPGAGKTMLAERLPGLLPPLGLTAALEVGAIASIAGTVGPDADLPRRAPFVAPHHGASPAAIIGGGSGRIRPGSITLAHRGILFLDEAPEFKPAVLQSLRQPLESGQVVIARAHDVVRFPARFQLVMAANPCPCGLLTGTGEHCECPPPRRRGYLARLSGPLLDRVDVQVEVLAPTRAELAAGPGEASAQVAARCAQARTRQRERWRGSAWMVNARVPGPVLRSSPWRLPPQDTRDIDAALDKGWLTLRGYDRCLRIAWTLADLRGAPRPQRRDVAEALSLRQRAGSPS